MRLEYDKFVARRYADFGLVSRGILRRSRVVAEGYYSRIECADASINTGINVSALSGYGRSIERPYEPLLQAKRR